MYSRYKSEIPDRYATAAHAQVRVCRPALRLRTCFAGRTQHTASRVLLKTASTAAAARGIVLVSLTLYYLIVFPIKSIYYYSMSNLAIYGKGTYGKPLYGDWSGGHNRPHNFYAGIPLALEVRGQIEKNAIFRIRRGNGYAGSKVGRKYQDRYKYFVPTSINNVEGQAARNKFASAIYTWHLASDADKQLYNAVATRRGGLSGFNLYIQNYMLNA